MSKVQTMIWRDRFDPDIVHVGKRTINSVTHRVTFYIVCTGPFDDFCDILDGFKVEDMERIDSTPREISLSATLYEEEDDEASL